MIGERGDRSEPTADVEVLAVDWRRLVRVVGASLTGGEPELANRAFRRGVELLRNERPPDRPDPDVTLQEQAGLLRRLLAWQGADVAIHRFTIATNREQYAESTRREQVVYEAKVSLDVDIVPPLKAEAKQLRATVRALEERLRSAGGDPDAVEPRIDWQHTLAVESSGHPRLQTVEDRRKAAIDVFREFRQ